MRQSIRALGWMSNILWAAVIIFSITLLYSVTNVALSLGEAETTFDERDLSFSVPLSISNGGYCEITGLNVTTRVFDYQMVNVSESSTYIGRVASRSERNSSITFHLSTDDITSRNLTHLFFDDNDLTIESSLSLRFTQAIQMRASTNASLPWGAVLYNFTVGKPVFRFNLTHRLMGLNISFENHSPYIGVTGNLELEAIDEHGEPFASGRMAIDVPSGGRFMGEAEMTMLDPQETGETGQIEVYFDVVEFDLRLVVPYG